MKDSKYIISLIQPAVFTKIYYYKILVQQQAIQTQHNAQFIFLYEIFSLELVEGTIH